jgi:thymidine kinase
VQLFKPSLDNRFGLENIASHDGLKRAVTFIPDATRILDCLEDGTRVVGIDEVQFFDSNVVEMCEGLANSGRTVVVSGLIKDFRDEYFPFRDRQGNMSELVRRADYMIYLKAICTHEEQNEICGREATRVQRFIDGRVAPYDSPLVVVGGKESYAPRCREHFHAYSEKARKTRTMPLFPDPLEKEA